MSEVNSSRDAILRFDDFRLDRHTGLSRLGADARWEPVVLGSRALDVLTALMEARGALLTKQTLMDAAWAGLAVEEANLTVQISILRRALDQGRAGGSRIQTVVGRGYRFLAAVTVEEAEPAVPGELNAAGAPRLSIIIIPFQNLSGDPNDDYLADGITDDLTSDLSHIPEAFVIANTSARTYKGRAVDARRIGQEVGVRHVVEGSMRRIGTVLRVNVQLISTETGAHVWSDRFEQSIVDLAAGQDAILARMRGALNITLLQIEAARALRAPSTAPNAFDLILQAWAVRTELPTQQRADRLQALYEEALRIDPSSVPAMVGLARHLIDDHADGGHWDTYEKMEHARTLLAQAKAIAPGSEEFLLTNTYWLRIQTGCQETMLSAQQNIEMFPNRGAGYNHLAWCKTATGHAEEEIPLQEKHIRLNPRTPYMFNIYRRMGYASLMLGRDQEAITFLEWSLALNPEARAVVRHWTLWNLAAAHTHTGDRTKASRAVAEAARLFPFGTVRGLFPDDQDPVHATQIRRYQEGLRLAGARDHADEDADSGVQASPGLSMAFVGHTPLTIPGATTIRTTGLPRFLAEQRPVILDPVNYSWGRSLPGAVGLKHAGIGGHFGDGLQDRLRRKVAALTGGDLNKPIVAVGWNAERFDGHNLALRLMALGYTNVHWYRGGREAWEVAGLPETELVPQAW